MTNDRREKRRFEVSLDATWDGSRGTYDARISDLSATGCYVDAINETLPGEILRLKVQISSGDWLEINGEVTHSFTSVGFGLRFVDMDSEQLAKLNALLEHLEISSKDSSSEIGS
ncbi:MAG TPA: PilZ domain-containing protein [Pyrinomonadaceae bacterium]|jgi:PilZ domain.|nr:PilZ domain-containing protein [Pyrinomonadaceae bacterium]